MLNDGIMNTKERRQFERNQASHQRVVSEFEFSELEKELNEQRRNEDEEAKDGKFSNTMAQSATRQPVSILKSAATPKGKRDFHNAFGQTGTVRFKDVITDEQE